MFALRLEKFPIVIYIAEKIYGEDRQRTSSRRDVNFYAVVVREIKNGLSVGKG